MENLELIILYCLCWKWSGVRKLVGRFDKSARHVEIIAIAHITLCSSIAWQKLSHQAQEMIVRITVHAHHFLCNSTIPDQNSFSEHFSDANKQWNQYKNWCKLLYNFDTTTRQMCVCLLDHAWMLIIFLAFHHLLCWIFCWLLSMHWLFIADGVVMGVTLLEWLLTHWVSMKHRLVI